MRRWIRLTVALALTLGGLVTTQARACACDCVPLTTAEALAGSTAQTRPPDWLLAGLAGAVVVLAGAGGTLLVRRARR